MLPITVWKRNSTSSHHRDTAMGLGLGAAPPSSPSTADPAASVANRRTIPSLLSFCYPRRHRRGGLAPSALPSIFGCLALVSSVLVILFFLQRAVDDVFARTRTVAGHNLEPTPWHPFPHNKERPDASTVLRCSYLSCSPLRITLPSHASFGGDGDGGDSSQQQSCPAFFSWIHRDLEPWRRSGISLAMVAEAGKHAAMRVVILDGRRLYVDLYYACVQSRAMFTIWGLLQLLRRYPGKVPDVDLMFDCMDRPAINRSDYQDGTPPPPLFRYCTTKDHFDIPFPDWSFWGWPEIHIGPWDEEFSSIKLGSQAINWKRKDKTAYWKGNPDVQSPIRMALLNCNDTKKWRAQIMRQDWLQESTSGFHNSNLSSQCNHRYKIYAEGFAWSVSLKYIIACGSLALIIHPQYEDFFSRGLIPKENYWPINPTNLCESIKSVVDWGNNHQSQAESVGKRGQAFMEDLNMDRVYDYMYHLIVEYSKLQDFKPVPPSSAQEVCVESILCVADNKQSQFLERSYASPSSFFPCTLPPPQNDVSKS
ncbi:O-glucosyltransferase rumi homolog [Phoenix dactylifera]|uniref:O-glucosyltransferase rumi homolog n=1 Tax=Phoenix dactylifera TaxID=42345 RepID=A0A8B7C3W6_PHODC|nr:O-glucosyltransferase rumi homolog [Phoenix dactylifera]